MINDLFILAAHDALLEVELYNGNIKKYIIPLNMQLNTYLSMMANLEMMEKTESANEKLIYLSNAVLFLLHDKHIDIEWIMQNISVENQQSIITEITTAINNLLENEIFKLPEIDIKKKQKSGKQDDNDKKRNTIEQLYKQLEGKLDSSVLDDITMLMSETHNSYWDVLKMPILVYRDLVKLTMLKRLKQDDDYLLAWLQNEKKKINREELKTIKKSSPTKKASLDEIMAYFS